MEMTFHGWSGAAPVTHASRDHVADEATPSDDHMGIRWALFWLIVGSAMVGTAIVAFGWRRTLEVWLVSGVALALVFVGERLWYKYIRKSE